MPDILEFKDVAVSKLESMLLVPDSGGFEGKFRQEIIEDTPDTSILETDETSTAVREARKKHAFVSGMSRRRSSDTFR